MSRENVEIVRKAMDAFNRRDRDAWLALNNPELEFRADPEWPESRTVRVREAVWDFIVNLTDAWEQGAFEMVEVIHAGDDKLAARFQATRSGQGQRDRGRARLLVHKHLPSREGSQVGVVCEPRQSPRSRRASGVGVAENVGSCAIRGTRGSAAASRGALAHASAGIAPSRSSGRSRAAFFGMKTIPSAGLRIPLWAIETRRERPIASAGLGEVSRRRRHATTRWESFRSSHRPRRSGR